jgi:hypothetical protein
MSRVSRGAKKSIYGKLADKNLDAGAVPIQTHGSKLAHQLHLMSERIINPRLGRIKFAK